MSYLALLALLASTVGMSFVPTGHFGTAISLTIAVAKAGVILWFFMQLGSATALTRMIAVTGILWLAILFSLSFSDYGSRDMDVHDAVYPSMQD